jgi:hypothetical protein
MSLTYKHGHGLTQIGATLNQSAVQLFAPTEEFGIYIQPASTILNNYHIFHPINKTGDVAVYSIRPNYNPILRIFAAGIHKGYKAVNPTTSGTFTAGKTAYTTTANNTISLTFTGTSVTFYSFTDDRGGMWSFSVDGGAAVVKSTWAASGSYLKQLIATGLTYGEHTIVGTFTGADPDHAPTGGIARGWVCLDTTTSGEYYFYKGIYYQNYQDFNYVLSDAGINYDIKCMIDGAINEYAFSVRKNGSATAYTFIPDHAAAAATVRFTDEATQKFIYLDGVAMSYATNAGGLATKYSEIKYTQEYIGFNENDPAQDLISVSEIMTFNYQGVKQEHTITALQDLESSICYGSMLPNANVNFDNMIVDGVEYLCTATDGSYTDLPSPAAWKNAISTKKSGTGEEMKVVLGMESVVNQNSGLRLVYTSATMHKLYTILNELTVIPTGMTYTFKTNYFINKIDDAYTYAALKLL